MAQIYVNENFPLPSVEALRELGHDVLTTMDSGNAGQAIPDEEVLAYARDQARILVTFNRKHFVRLHHANNNHAGIIVCTVDVDFVALAERIHIVLQETDDMIGTLVRVNRPSDPSH